MKFNEKVKDNSRASWLCLCCCIPAVLYLKWNHSRPPHNWNRFSSLITRYRSWAHKEKRWQANIWWFLFCHQQASTKGSHLPLERTKNEKSNRVFFPIAVHLNNWQCILTLGFHSNELKELSIQTTNPIQDRN